MAMVPQAVRTTNRSTATKIAILFDIETKYSDQKPSPPKCLDTLELPTDIFSIIECTGGLRH